MSSAVKRRGRGAGGPEFISLDGLRIDGRRAGEVRKIRCSLGALSRADGSAYFEQGNTRVLAAVYGPREPPRAGGSGGVGSAGGGAAAGASGATGGDGAAATVTCEVSTALFAHASRARGWKGDRRSTALARVVQRVFEGVVLLRAYQRSQIDIYVQVLQNDGGALAAAINAASLALVNAGVAMSDLVVACTVGYVDAEFVVDVSALESSADRPQLSVAVLAHAKKIAAAELDSKLPSVAVLDSALMHAQAGCGQIFRVLEHEIRQYSLNLLDSRGLVAF